MKTFIKLCVLLVGLSLSACASKEVGPITPVFGGSANGGYDLQTACSAVMNAAGCTLNTRRSNGQIDMQQIAIKSSVQGNITETAATVGISKAADFAIARNLQKKAAGCDGCGGQQTIVQVQTESNSASNASAKQKRTGGCSTCGSKKKKVLMQ